MPLLFLTLMLATCTMSPMAPASSSISGPLVETGIGPSSAVHHRHQKIIERIRGLQKQIDDLKQQMIDAR